MKLNCCKMTDIVNYWDCLVCDESLKSSCRCPKDLSVVLLCSSLVSRGHFSMRPLFSCIMIARLTDVVKEGLLIVNLLKSSQITSICIALLGIPLWNKNLQMKSTFEWNYCHLEEVMFASGNATRTFSLAYITITKNIL